MTAPVLRDEADCPGPSYDRQGGLSEECRACGKCDVAARLLKQLMPAAHLNNQSQRPAAHAA